MTITDADRAFLAISLDVSSLSSGGLLYSNVITTYPAKYNYPLAELSENIDFSHLKDFQDMRIQKLATILTFRDPHKVYRFLKAYPYLIDLLPEAISQVERLFGTSTPVELEVISDPDGAGTETLFAYIVTSLPVDNALGLMDKLDYQWYLNQPIEVMETFNFNLCLYEL